MFRFAAHSVEIAEFFCPQILREINFAEFRNYKTAVFASLGALNCVDLVNFCLLKVKEFI